MISSVHEQKSQTITNNTYMYTPREEQQSYIVCGIEKIVSADLVTSARGKFLTLK